MEKYIYFNSRDTLIRIELSRIAYFEADKNYTNLHLTNGQKLVFTFGLGIMKDYIIKNLGEDANRFIRLGKSLIINTMHLFQINLLKQNLQLYDKNTNRLITIAVSKEALKKLKDFYINTINVK